MTARELSGVVKEAGLRMANDQTLMMGAALAYYMMFSIAPLLIIAIGAAGWVFGGGAGAGVFEVIDRLVGAQAAQAVRSMVTAVAGRPHAGLVATAVGVVTMIIGASGVFSQLQASLNMIWRVQAKPGATWRVLIRQRLLSFGMIAVFGLLMLVSLLVSAGLSAAGKWAAGAMPGGALLWSGVNVAVSFAIIAALFSAVLKFLPDVRLSWRDVRVGGAVTALLFVAGKAAIGAYLGRSGVSSSYGAAGSLIVILLWVYYSSQIVFFGAEFTRAWALREGRHVAPKRGAALTGDVLAIAPPRPPEFPPGPASAWTGAGGAALLAAFYLLTRRPRRAGAAAAGGLAGVALAVLGLTWLARSRENGESGDDRPSWPARLTARIPLRVKLAAAGGALRGGGREAVRELREHLRSK